MLTFVVGGLQGDGPEGIDVANLENVDDTVDASACLGVGTDDVGNLQTCGIETLRRRVKRDTVVQVGLVDSSEGDELVPRHCQFTMNFIADNLHMVSLAYLTHLRQLLACPHSSRRVVRIAQQKYRCLLIGTLLLEVGPVYDIAVAFSLERALRYLAALVADGGEEAVVDRSQHEHLLTGQRQGFDGAADGRHDTRGVEYPVTVDDPLMATAEPRDDGVVIAVVYAGIAEDTVLYALGQCFLDGRCHLKVHVGHP